MFQGEKKRGGREEGGKAGCGPGERLKECGEYCQDRRAFKI